MTTNTKLENAVAALGTAVERYDCMGWYDESADEDCRREANEMTEALDAVGVALDRALERYDCMGAMECNGCGQGLKQFGYMNPCECEDGFDHLSEEALEIKTALEALRTEEPEGGPEEPPCEPLLKEMTPAVKQLLGLLESEIERREEFKGDESYQEDAARLCGFVDAIEGRDNSTKFEYPLSLAYQAGVTAAHHLAAK